jgi:hypothetical protein
MHYAIITYLENYPKYVQYITEDVRGLYRIMNNHVSRKKEENCSVK